MCLACDVAQTSSPASSSGVPPREGIRNAGRGRLRYAKHIPAFSVANSVSDQTDRDAEKGYEPPDGGALGQAAEQPEVNAREREPNAGRNQHRENIAAESHSKNQSGCGVDSRTQKWFARREEQTNQHCQKDELDDHDGLRESSATTAGSQFLADLFTTGTHV